MKPVALFLASLVCILFLSRISLATDDAGVSLHVANESAQSAFDKLFGGMSLTVHANPQLWEKYSFNRVTMDVSGGHFWDVMAELNRATGICMSQVKGDEVVLFMDHGMFSRRPSTVVGPLRVTAMSAESQSAMELTKTRTTSRFCKIALNVICDPRIHPVSLEIVKPEAPQNAAPPPRGGQQQQSQPQIVSFNSGQANLQVDVDANDTGKGTADISRSFLFSRTTRANPMTVMVGAGDNRTEKDFGDLKGVLEFQPGQKGYSAHIRLVNQRLDPKQWQRVATAIYTSPPILTDASGRQYANDAASGNRNGGDINYTVNFIADRSQGPLGEPHKLLWNIPVAIETEPITIELKNLELP